MCVFVSRVTICASCKSPSVVDPLGGGEGEGVGLFPLPLFYLISLPLSKSLSVFIPFLHLTSSPSPSPSIFPLSISFRTAHPLLLPHLPFSFPLSLPSHVYPFSPLPSSSPTFLFLLPFSPSMPSPIPPTPLFFLRPPTLLLFSPSSSASSSLSSSLLCGEASSLASRILICQSGWGGGGYKSRFVCSWVCLLWSFDV